MEQEIIIFDEATSMLDPKGVKDMMETIINIHKQFKKTIIMITHDLRQAGYTDDMLIMKDGTLIAQGTPSTLFQDVKLLRSTQLLLPFELELYEKAKELNMNEKVIHALWAYNSKT